MRETRDGRTKTFFFSFRVDFPRWRSWWRRPSSSISDPRSRKSKSRSRIRLPSLRNVTSVRTVREKRKSPAQMPRLTGLGETRTRTGLHSSTTKASSAKPRQRRSAAVGSSRSVTSSTRLTSTWHASVHTCNNRLLPLSLALCQLAGRLDCLPVSLPSLDLFHDPPPSPVSS